MATDKSGKIRILLIDDDPDIRASVRISLKMEGHEVIEAPNGESGVRLAKSENPDIIVLDVEMPPGIGGPEVCRRLRKDPETEDIPIIFLTARVDLDAMEKTLEEEAQAYVLKPFPPIDLLNKIEEVLGRTPDES